jgi:hypothetical protein
MGAKRKRFNARLPADLLEFVAKYAKENNTTTTAVIIDLIIDLRKKVHSVEVEQF